MILNSDKKCVLTKAVTAAAASQVCGPYRRAPLLCLCRKPQAGMKGQLFLHSRENVSLNHRLIIHLCSVNSLVKCFKFSQKDITLPGLCLLQTAVGSCGPYGRAPLVRLCCKSPVLMKGHVIFHRRETQST